MATTSMYGNWRIKELIAVNDIFNRKRFSMKEMPFEARNNYYKFSLSTGVGALHSPVLNVEFDGKFSRLMYYRNVIKEEIGKCESSDAFTERGHNGDISNEAGYIPRL